MGGFREWVDCVRDLYVYLNFDNMIFCKFVIIVYWYKIYILLKYVNRVSVFVVLWNVVVECREYKDGVWEESGVSEEVWDEESWLC